MTISLRQNCQCVMNMITPVMIPAETATGVAAPNTKAILLVDAPVQKVDAARSTIRRSSSVKCGLIT